MEPQLQSPYFVTALDEHKLKVDLIVSIMRPMISSKGGSLPQPLRVTVRVKETKTEATLVFEDDNGERTLTQIQTMTSYGKGKQLTTKQKHSQLIIRALGMAKNYFQKKIFY